MTRKRILWKALVAVATMSAGILLTAPASPAHATMTGFKSVQGSDGWVDFTGDRRADQCYVTDVGPWCRAATATGFGSAWTLRGTDSGYWEGRAWADLNGDSRADYCRVIESWGYKAQCTLSNGAGWGSTITSGSIDPGYNAGRAWADVNGDNRADYCRVIESWGYKVQCTLSSGAGFGTTITSGALDPGYDQGRSWADVNGDNRADYCRIVGGGTKYMQCTLSNGTGFGVSITSAAMDPGYDDSRRWADVNGDRKADYCRIVGSAVYSSTNLRCTVSTGTGFGLTFTSGLLDAGYANTGTWADVTGDGRDDYCRIIGNYQGSCTISTGGGFSGTFTTPIASRQLAGWADFNNDGRADLCRLEAGTQRCTVSNGTSFGVTYG